jgi:hypothetical protein
VARNTLILLGQAIERVGLPPNGNQKLPSSRFGEHHFYRKTELFDRLLAFDVQVDLSEGARH